MAISATFSADFSKFNDAVTKAEAKLKDFSSGAGVVEKSLNRMVDTFSGRKVIQDATLMAEAIERLGGVSKLTANELATVGAKANEAAAKMKAMGVEVPPGLQKIADATKGVGTAASQSTSLLGGMSKQLAGMFTIGAIVAFGNKVLQAGDQIEKMADQTGLSTAEVQKLQYVAGQSGSSMESLVGAVQNLQQRLGDDSTGAAGAMARLGINAEAFNKLDTYAQMTSLSEAVRNVKDPTEQASLAAALFGKSWKEILPAIKAGMQEVGAQAPVMSDQAVKALDAIGDAMARLKQSSMVWAGEIVLHIEKAGFAFGDYLSRFDPTHWGTANSELLKHAENLARVDNILSGAQVPAKQYNDGIKAITLSTAELNDIYRESTKAIEGSIAKNTALAAARGKLAAETKKAKDEEVKLATALVRTVESTEDLKVTTLSLNDAFKAMPGTRIVPTLKDIADTSLRSATDVKGLSGSVEELQRKGLFTQAALEKMGITIGTLPNVTGAAADAFGDMGDEIEGMGDEAERAAAKVHDEMVDAIRGIVSAFDTLASTSDGVFGDMMGQAADVVASYQRMTVSAAKFKAATTTGGKAAAGAEMGAEAYASVMAATSQGNVHQRAIGGAMSGGMSGAAIGSIVPVLGTAVGFGIGAGVGALVGWYRSGKADKDMRKAREAFVQAAGGLEQLNQRAHDAGMTLDSFLDAKHPKEYGEALDALTGKIHDHEQAVQDTARAVDGVSQAFAAAGNYIPTTMRPTLDALRSMPGLTAAQRQELALMTSSAEPDFAKLTEMASGYGITLEGLGGKFQQANISDTAAQIFKDFDLLTQAGADVGGVLSGMADEISALVQHAQKFGAVIPENMKPLIENLLDAGKLTDENGDKLTDLSKITFGATPLDKSTNAIVDAINRLKDVLEQLPDVAARSAAGVSSAFGSVQIGTSGGAAGTGADTGGAGALAAASLAADTRGRVLNFTGGLAALHRRPDSATTTAAAGRLDDLTAAVAQQSAALQVIGRYLTQDFAPEVSRLVKTRAA